MPTWKDMVAANPQHSYNYAARWDMFKAQGKDIVGEARLIDAMAPRHARILDAGCGTGRLGGYLATCGHDVWGSDLDPVLIERAQQDFPDSQWMVGDLAKGEVPEGEFDIVFSAGNVMGFIAPEDRQAVIETMASKVAAGGRLVVGFGAGRGWHFDNFIEMVNAAGLKTELLLSSWDVRPYYEGSDFLVAIFSR
ncbi:MAG: class I SAM-dependent methyltransferase [Corynebacterium sp.]|nr:class I SAM-dependent methyltransferase [Corynebacterium sp.]